ncbi:MAG TPA: hypothetical protein PKA90_13255 [Ignavibacteria bacterium]|nr:hypothetical protein [Ignavibacteria bacterium]HMR41386.1 hypothetical protein [Ignavibacteria bacterium]
MKKIKYTFTVIFLILLSFTLNAQQVSTEWVINNFPGFPVGVMIGLDQQDNIFVAGQSGDHTKIIVTKYDTGGNLIWQRFYTISGLAVVATWLSVDNTGNIIVTGYPHTFSSNPVESGLLTLKYDNDGNLLWDRLISGTWAFAIRSVTDQSGNIYVTGRAWQYTATYDFVTVKYAPDGTQIWFDTFDQNSGFHTPTGMDLDQNGNLYIAGGGISGGLITAKYDTGGNRQWVREHSGTAGQNVKTDNNGGIFVTGSYYDVNTGTGNDFMFLKYNVNGDLTWQKFYDFGNSEYGKYINIDSHSNIYLTGFGAVPGGFFPGFLTAKLDTGGTLLWYKRFKYNNNWEEFPNYTLLGPNDEIYITGNVGVVSGGNTYQGLETVRFNSDGSAGWTADVNLYAGPGMGLAPGSDKSIYAVGQFYYSVLKYSQTYKLNLSLMPEGFYDPVTGKMATDTVTVYLRNASPPYSLTDSSEALIDSNGTGMISFLNADNGTPYYIQISHRNSIETWSSAGNSFSSGVMNYDFTISATSAFGNNQKLKGTKFCIYSGDVNQDGLTDLSDITLVFNDAANFATGYIITDVTGDNIADLTDLTITFNNSANFVSKIIP